MSETPPQPSPGSWRVIIIMETNLSRMSLSRMSLSRRPDHCLCLPDNVPVTKAAVFTILVIFHYPNSVSVSVGNVVCRSEWDLREMARSDRCWVLGSHGAMPGYSELWFWGISHGTLEIVGETEELEIMWPSLSVFVGFPARETKELHYHVAISPLKYSHQIRRNNCCSNYKLNLITGWR